MVIRPKIIIAIRRLTGNYILNLSFVDVVKINLFYLITATDYSKLFQKNFLLTVDFINPKLDDLEIASLI